MGLDQIIILIAYVVGFLIIFIHQKNKIGTLITQTKKQKSILEQVEKFMNIFDLDKVEKYVQMNERRVHMETEETIKKVKKQYESEAKKDTEFYQYQVLDLLGVLSKLSFVFAYEPYFEKSINEIKSEFNRKILLDSIQKAREELKSIGIEDKGVSGVVLRAILTRMDFGQKK